MTDDRVIELLVLNELAIARLYQLFSEQQPALKIFWLGMRNEERAHADVLRALQKARPLGEVVLGRRGFEPAAVETAISYLERRIGIAERDAPSSIQALALSIDIERSMIEKEFFTVYEPNSDVMQSEFKQLRDHTGAHIQRLQRQLEEIRAEGGA